MNGHRQYRIDRTRRASGKAVPFAPLARFALLAIIPALVSSLSAQTYEKDFGKPLAERNTDENDYRPGNPDSMVYIDFEQPVLYNPAQDVKDHSIIFVDGLFHAFYIVANERSFGHATSPDLVHWTFHDPVLTKGEPGDWDEKDIWAPCVVPLEGFSDFYLMYYTGNNAWSAQQTGLAYSTGDLYTWCKAEESLMEPFACDTNWCEWNEYEYCHCRDPNVLNDDGTYWLTQTVRTLGGAYGAVSLVSGDGKFSWSDAGPMYVHENWHLLESTFVFKRNGKYHLFFTEEGLGGTSHMASEHLTSGWDINYRSIIDFGHAPEIQLTQSGAYVFSRHTSYLDYTGDMVYSIRFDTLGWSGDYPYVNIKLPLSDWTMLWGTAFIHQPVFGDAFDFRGDYETEVGFVGNWWIGTAERFEGPVLGYRPGARQGDGPKGAIRSEVFTVTGRSMTLLVGGGEYPDSCWVSLHRASNGEMLFKETGRGVELMDLRTWNIEQYMGSKVYLEIVDDCSSVMGHINVDEIRESPFPVGSSDGDSKGHNNEGYPLLETIDSEEVSASAGSSSPPPSSGSISCSPNPFNPATVISFAASPDAVCEVVVFSVAGRRIWTGVARTSSDGTGSVTWNGRSDSGREVASGVYAAALVDRGRITGIAKLVLLR